MGPPSVLQRFRQIVGRAFRETGQALDRLGVKTASLAVTPHDYYDDPVVYEDHLSRHRHQFPLLWSGKPMISADVAYLAPCSTLIGSVHIGPGASVWYGAVLRADECANAESFDSDTGEFELDERRFRDRTHHHGGAIFVGANSNIQDGCILTARSNHCRIGNGVTVGHLAQIHSATVEDYCLIGMGSIIQEGARIETEAFVAAGAVIGKGQVVKSGELWVGNPGRKIRDLSAAEREKLHYQSSEYVLVATNQRGVMELGGNLSEAELLAAADEDEQASLESQEGGETIMESSEERLRRESGSR